MPGPKRMVFLGTPKRKSPLRTRSKTKTVVVRNRMGHRRSMVNRNMHSFRRWTNEVRHNVTSTVGQFSYECTFDSIRGYTDFTDLYDRYMITCVVMRFRLVNNPNSTWSLNTNPAAQTAMSANFYPAMYYCKDYDDSAAETLEQLKERANTKRMILQPNKMYKIVLRPAVTMQTYATATSTGYAPKWKQWIDMANTSVPHYGLKYVVDCSAQDPADTQPFILERSTQIFFKCKDVR